MCDEAPKLEDRNELENLGSSVWNEKALSLPMSRQDDGAIVVVRAVQAADPIRRVA
jgi:hypothetical protein